MSISSETSECAICLEEKGGFIAQLSCGHTYHYSCVQSWIKKKNNLKRSCCICDKDTEIIGFLGEEPIYNPPEKYKKNIFVEMLGCCSIL